MNIDTVLCKKSKYVKLEGCMSIINLMRVNNAKKNNYGNILLHMHTRQEKFKFIVMSSRRCMSRHCKTMNESKKNKKNTYIFK